MRAVNYRFVEIIDGNKQFKIPVFQRDYSWSTGQCLQLWESVMSASSEDSGGHFMGSFVYIEESTGAVFNRWLVIDGQQRLTSLTLLLIALRDHIREVGWVGGEDDPTVDHIDAYFLKNKQEKGDRSYKLALRRHDNETLWALVDGRDPGDIEKSSGLIVDAYQYFRARLKNSESDPNEVYKGVSRLNIVDVKLERHIDNPQLIFESLNSTGVDLSQSDLVRNYLLMGLPEEDQTRLYNDYWSKLENDFRTAGTEPDSFLRDYIALKRKSTIQARAENIYTEFKKFAPPSGAESTGVLLADLVKFARYYVSFLRPSLSKDENKVLVDTMMDVRPSGFSNTLAPLIMRLYDCYARECLCLSDFIQALKLIKSYLIRRAVLGLQTRNYWSVFIRMALSVDDKAPFASFQVALARQSHKYRFPSDKEFVRAIQENDLYGLRLCFHILECLENTGQPDPSPVKNYSIEHIMPQSIEDVPDASLALTSGKSWKQMLGGDWETIQTTWLHRLGNLTLIASKNNSTISNKPFEEKKNIKGGFKDGAARLNRYIREQEQWTALEMQARGKLLAKRAVEIWPYHEADPELIQEEEIRYLRGLASRRNWEDLEMSDPVRALLRAVKELFGDIGQSIEVIENKSVCFYDNAANFFAELLPMSYYLRVLVPLDFDEVDDPEGLASDVKAWKFLPNVTHRDCGVFMDVSNKLQIKPTTAIVHQAFNLERD